MHRTTHHEASPYRLMPSTYGCPFASPVSWQPTRPMAPSSLSRLEPIAHRASAETASPSSSCPGRSLLTMPQRLEV